MRIRSKSWLVLSLSLGTGVPASAHVFAEDGQRSEAGATIRVYDLAHLDASVLGRAKRETERVFLNAGIELRWIDCLRGGKNEETCGQPLRSGEVAMRILTRTEKDIEATGRLTNGIAIRTGPGQGISGMASIFYERTEVIAEQVRNDCLQLKAAEARGIVLGHFMAHEIGHILLPTNSHSAAGIMKERLDRPEWGLAVRGILLFTRQESELIRQRLQETRRTTGKNRGRSPVFPLCLLPESRSTSSDSVIASFLSRQAPFLPQE